MKRLLLTTAIMAMTVGAGFSQGWERMHAQQKAPARAEAPTRADGEDGFILFGYCQDFYDGLGQAGNLSAAIEIPEDQAKQWKGNRITSVRIAIGTAMGDYVTVFITDDLKKGTRFVEQEEKIVVREGWNSFTLNTPYEITGEKFFIGYSYDNSTRNEYPIGVDGIPTQNTLGDYIALGGNWDHIGSFYGNICIRAVIEGDNLPVNDIELLDFAAPEFVKPGAPFNATARIINQGSNVVSDLEIAATVGGQSIPGVEYAMEPARLLPGDNGTLSISGLTSFEEGLDMELDVTVTKVNGQSDSAPQNNTVSTDVCSFSKGFHRNNVVEEWTGTWCGYCPRGIVGMEYMKEKYSEDGFIGIAVHGNSQGMPADPMTVSAFTKFLNTFVLTGFPGCTMNRYYTFDPNKQSLEYYYNLFNQWETYVEVENLTAELSDSRLSVKSLTTFSVSGTNTDFRLAFVVTENDMGPFNQSNYYAGGGSGALDGWEKKPSMVSWIYEDVARNVTDCFGTKGSIPANIEAGKAYEYETTVPITNVTNLSNCYLTALVIEFNSGEIMNAKRISLYEAGVGEIAADDADYPVEYFTLDGRRVLNPDKGIFIKRQGCKAVKVIL